jgi:hypothetical protein
MQGARAEIARIDASRDDAWVVTSSRTDRVEVWNTSAGRLLQTLPTRTPLPGVAFSSDGKLLVVPSGEELDVYS